MAREGKTALGWDKPTQRRHGHRSQARGYGNKAPVPLLAAARPASPQAAQALQKSKRHWTEVQSILAKFGRNEIDPIQASRRIRKVTGGKDIPQVVDEAAQMIESLGRYVGW